MPGKRGKNWMLVKRLLLQEVISRREQGLVGSGDLAEKGKEGRGDAL